MQNVGRSWIIGSRRSLLPKATATWSRDEEGALVCVFEDQDADYQLDTWAVGEEEIPIRGVRFELPHWQSKRNYGIKFKPEINLRWAIRRRDRRFDFRPEKVPDYTKHCSHQSIMGLTGCSRATAFRWSRSSWLNLHLSRSCGRPQFVLRPIQERIAGSSLSLGKPFTAADFSVQRGWRGMGKARSPLAGGNVCTKILLHIQLHNLSQTHPNCPK